MIMFTMSEHLIMRRERRCRVLSFCLCCSTRMAGNRGGPDTQADQPDPVGRMAELFAQVGFCSLLYMRELQQKLK